MTKSASMSAPFGERRSHILMRDPQRPRPDRCSIHSRDRNIRGEGAPQVEPVDHRRDPFRMIVGVSPPEQRLQRRNEDRTQPPVIEPHDPRELCRLAGVAVEREPGGHHLRLELRAREGGVDHRLDALKRRRGGAEANEQVGAQGRQHAPHRLEQQIVLVDEVMVHDAGRDPRLGGDAGDCRIGETEFVDRGDRRVDELAPPDRAHTELWHRFVLTG